MAVYFVRCSATDLVKIGFTAGDARIRFSSIQTGSAAPLSLERVIEGTAETEAELHAHFRDRRVRGEWFRLTVAEVSSVEGTPPKPRPAPPPAPPPRPPRPMPRRPTGKRAARPVEARRPPTEIEIQNARWVSAIPAPTRDPNGPKLCSALGFTKRGGSALDFLATTLPPRRKH